MKFPHMDGVAAGGKEQENIIFDDLQKVSKLPNSALYRFFDALIEGVRRGEFDSQIKEISHVIKVFRSKKFTAEKMRVLSNSSLREKFFSKKDDGVYRSVMPFSTPNGISLRIYAPENNDTGFLWWTAHRKTTLRCEIRAGNKKYDLEVVYNRDKKSMPTRTISGFVQLKDLYYEVLSRMNLLDEENNKNGTKEMNDKLMEFSDSMEEKDYRKESGTV